MIANYEGQFPAQILSAGNENNVSRSNLHFKTKKHKIIRQDDSERDGNKSNFLFPKLEVERTENKQ
ncbi:MAG TPA: hypothetical protein VHY08_21000 [Bacillota bacterium]|nr:hypothetical protein [Bacillota bacterium]